MDVVLAILLALAGGAVGGLLGVGGGILFVPALAIFLGNTQLEAEATSLLVIVPMAIIGTWRQHRHGNVDLREGVTIGLLSLPGVDRRRRRRQRAAAAGARARVRGAVA